MLPYFYSSTFHFAFAVHRFRGIHLSVALLDLLYHITLFSFQGAEKEYASKKCTL